MPATALLVAGLALVAAWRALEPGADQQPFGRSVHVGLVAAATALVMGLIGGALHARRLPLRRALLALAVAPLVVPPFLVALGWIDLLGPAGRVVRALGGAAPAGPSLLATSPLYTPWACGLLLGAALHPIVLLSARAALLRVDPAALEAATLARGSAGARWVALAAALPAALAGALVVLVLTVLERATPLLVLRGVPVPVQVEEIAIRFATERDPWLAARAGLPLVGLVLVAAGALRLAWRRPAAGAGALGRPRPATPALRLAGPLVCLALVTPGLVVPLVSLGLQLADVSSSTDARSGAGAALAELQLALRLGGPDALRSAAVGVATALLVVLVSTMIAWPLRPAAAGRARASRALATVALALALALAVVPPPLVGIALDVLARRSPALDPVTDGPAIVVAACALRFLPVGALLLFVALRRVPREQDEAAWLAGRAAPRVVLPQVAPAAAAAALVVHVLTVTEYGASAVVEPPGASLLAVFVVNEAHYGAGPALAGLLLLLLIVAAAPPLCVTAARVWSGSRA